MFSSCAHGIGLKQEAPITACVFLGTGCFFRHCFGFYGTVYQAQLSIYGSHTSYKLAACAYAVPDTLGITCSHMANGLCPAFSFLQTTIARGGVADFHQGHGHVSMLSGSTIWPWLPYSGLAHGGLRVA